MLETYITYITYNKYHDMYNAREIMVVVYLALEMFLFMEVDSIDFELKILLTKVT